MKFAHETHEMTRKEGGTGLIRRDESYAIIGACFALYKQLEYDGSCRGN